MFHHMLKAEFVTLVSLKVPSGTVLYSAYIIAPVQVERVLSLVRRRRPHPRPALRGEEGREGDLLRQLGGRRRGGQEQVRTPHRAEAQVRVEKV